MRRFRSAASGVDRQRPAAAASTPFVARLVVPKLDRSTHFKNVRLRVE